MKTLKHFLAIGAGTLMPLLASAQCELNGKEVPCEELTQGAAGWILGGGLVFLGIMMLLLLVLTIFWIWMLVHAIAKPIENKAVWIVLMLIFGIPVSIAYFFLVKRKFQEAPAPTQPAA